MVLKSEKVFATIKRLMKDQGGIKETVDKVQGLYQFHIYKEKGGKISIWTVDLKNGKGTPLFSFITPR